MGTLLPKVKTDGTVFDEFEYVTPQDFVHFEFEISRELYDKVYQPLGIRVFQPVQEVEKMVQAAQPDVEILIEALDNVAAMADPKGKKIDFGRLRQLIYPNYVLRERIPGRVFCAYPRSLPEILKVASEARVLQKLINIILPWERYWNA